MSVDQDRRFQEFQVWAALYDMYHSHELNEKVEELNTQLASQFDKSNKLQQSALDQLEKQTLILELQKEKNETENNIRELLFEFNIEANKIEKFSENLEKYIAAESLTKKLQLKNIKSKFLSTIADKEYHYNLIKRLEYISNSALKGLSNNDFNDLENLQNTKKELSMLTNEFSQDRESLKERIQNLEHTISSLRSRQQHYKLPVFFKIGIEWGIVIGIASFLVVAFDIIPKNLGNLTTVFSILAVASLVGWFPISCLMFKRAKIINSFDRKDNRPDTLKAISKADKEYYDSKKKLEKITANFNKKSQLLKENISSISRKYPSLNLGAI